MHDHRPYYRGSSCLCADCGQFLFDARTGARLRALEDVDPVRLAAVSHRFSNDPELAQRLLDEDPREVVSTYKLADKLNDFLRNPKARPDLQTPEGQEFLNTLDKGGYVNAKTDPLTPWMTKEWKKGRIRHHPNDRTSEMLQYQSGPDYEYEDIDGSTSNWHYLHPDELNHWADWYGSDHPSRQGKDIMQMETPEFHQTIKDWDTDMRDKAGGAAQKRGDILHTFPDGWTVQKLGPEHLEDEGEKMGHCVGSYGTPVADGYSHIYSLRDHQNEPHATWEVIPRNFYLPDSGENVDAGHRMNELRSRGTNLAPDVERVKELQEAHPEDLKMEQVQGKGNKPPVKDYQNRIKAFYEHTVPDINDRPTWDDQHYDDPEYLIDPDDGGYVAYHPGDYGLKQPKTTYDWPRMIDHALLNSGSFYDTNTSADKLTQKAVEHGQFKPFAQEADRQIALGREQHQNRMQNEFNSWWQGEGEPNAFEYGEYSYPDEEQYTDPETGKFDDNGFAKAEEEHQERRDEVEKGAYQDFQNDYIDEHQDMHEYMDELETEIAAQQYKEGTAKDQEAFRAQQQQTADQVSAERAAERTTSTKRPPHQHWSTGAPCYCTFALQAGSTPRTAKLPPTCEVCGDPLEHGKCKRCDWTTGPSNAMGDGDQNPIDPTKEMHPGIQASSQQWHWE